MYIPSHFRMSQPDEIAKFIEKNSFGILVSTNDGVPLATHVPFIYQRAKNCLLAHVAKANPQWKSLDGQAVMAIFSGPHAYISPSWYEVSNSVPTWNYVAAHVYGKCTVIQDADALADLLTATVGFYEPDSELMSQTDESFYQAMMKAIVGLKIEIEDVQAVAKMSQNKPEDVRQRVIDQLRQVGDADSGEVANWMERDRSKG